MRKHLNRWLSLRKNRPWNRTRSSLGRPHSHWNVGRKEGRAGEIFLTFHAQFLLGFFFLSKWRKSVKGVIYEKKKRFSDHLRSIAKLQVYLYFFLFLRARNCVWRGVRCDMNYVRINEGRKPWTRTSLIKVFILIGYFLIRIAGWLSNILNFIMSK